jgi:hypothetical protein
MGQGDLGAGGNSSEQYLSSASIFKIGHLAITGTYSAMKKKINSPLFKDKNTLARLTKYTVKATIQGS